MRYSPWKFFAPWPRISPREIAKKFLCKLQADPASRVGIKAISQYSRVRDLLEQEIIELKYTVSTVETADNGIL